MTNRRYVAFLRGINVGGHRVEMAELRRLFEGLRFSEVSTFIASGNVLFASPEADASALESRIERHLREALGYDVDTFLRTPAELAAIAAHQPFPDADSPDHTLYVSFLRAQPDEAAVRTLLEYQTERDEFHVNGRESYWRVRGKLTDSLVPWPKLEKAFGRESTMRNINTVRRLAAKLAGA
jgi:uncharacterized protein (DUF1697 family)